MADLLQLGLKASSLALLHQAALTPRLPATTLSTLIDDLDRLGVVVPGAKQARHEARVATADQEAALAAGYARVKAVRNAVKKSGAPGEIREAYGVGQVVKSSLVRDVTAVLQQILDRAAAAPAEAASFGILQKDLDAMTAAHQAISDADKAQEQKRASAPLSTQERNRTGNRILEAVGRIAGAGGLEFADKPDVRAAFTALKPPARKKASSKTAAATTPAKLAKPAAPAEELDQTG